MVAMNDANDFPMGSDEEIPRAIDGSGQFPDDREMVAANRGTRDRAGFLDDHIAAGFDPAVPGLGDLVIQQANITTALRALAGLRFTNRGELMPAIETSDLPGWFHRVKQAHQEGPVRWSRRAETAHHRGFWRWRCGFGIGIGIVAGRGQTRHGKRSHHTFAFAHLEVRPTSTALRGNHECGFGLQLPAFRACHFDAMALGLIGHGRAD